jgi:hypothetical protein
MERKSVVMSALGIGIGVGVGLGLASAPWAGGASASASARAAGVTVERVEQDLRRLLADGADSKVTFDEFPYYLRSSFLLRSALSSDVVLPCILLSAPTHGKKLLAAAATRTSVQSSRHATRLCQSCSCCSLVACLLYFESVC